MTASPPLPPGPDEHKLTSGGLLSIRPAYVGVAAILTWIAGSVVAWRILGFYPSKAARATLFLGWIVALAGAWGLASRAQRRAGWAVVLAASLVPAVLVVGVPGIKQPTIYPVPGGGSYATSAAPLGQYDLYLIRNGDGAHPFQLTHTPWSENWSALSPDGTHVAYTSAGMGSTVSLHLMTIDGEGLPVRDRILVTGVDPSYVSWSGDGSSVYFAKTAGSRVSMYAADVQGHDSLVADNAWGLNSSPDSTKVAFSRDGAVWVSGPDGGDAHQVASVRGGTGAPMWSPDGTKIAFDAGNDVYIVNADGTGLHDLTPNTGGEDYPCWWTPDGHLLFASDRSNTGGRFMYSMNADGSDVRLAWIL